MQFLTATDTYTVKIIVCMMIYKSFPCLCIQQEIQKMLWLHKLINLLRPVFSKPLSNLSFKTLLNHKKWNWFYVLHWCSFRVVGNYIFRSSCPELFYEKVLLKPAKFWNHLHWNLLFNKFSDWKPPTILMRVHGPMV